MCWSHNHRMRLMLAQNNGSWSLWTLGTKNTWYTANEKLPHFCIPFTYPKSAGWMKRLWASHTPSSNGNTVKAHFSWGFHLITSSSLVVYVYLDGCVYTLIASVVHLFQVLYSKNSIKLALNNSTYHSKLLKQFPKKKNLHTKYEADKKRRKSRPKVLSVDALFVCLIVLFLFCAYFEEKISLRQAPTTLDRVRVEKRRRRRKRKEWNANYLKSQFKNTTTKDERSGEMV